MDWWLKDKGFQNLVKLEWVIITLRDGGFSSEIENQVHQIENKAVEYISGSYQY